ncbi:MAG: sigma-E processing peptidase SpoIIGA, partial [Oscillospiraceae bacterium]
MNLLKEKLVIIVRQTIYIDVLVLINIYIGYFLFASTKRLLNLKINRWKFAISCVLCGFSSLLILIDMNAVELIITKIFCLIIICLPVFFNKNIKYFIKCVLTFFIVNIIFGGMMFAIWYFITPPAMQFKNGIVYFDISAIMIAIFTIITYIIICIFTHFFRRKTDNCDSYDMKISYQGREVLVHSMLDTGNKLSDIYSGLPVILCSIKSMKSLINQQLIDCVKSNEILAYDEKLQKFLIKEHIKIIPICCVSGKSSVLAFKPDNLVLLNKKGEKIHINGLIGLTENGFCDGEYDCI